MSGKFQTDPLPSRPSALHLRRVDHFRRDALFPHSARARERREINCLSCNFGLDRILRVMQSPLHRTGRRRPMMEAKMAKQSAASVAQTGAEVLDRYRSALDDGRLIQFLWHCTDDDGRDLACALGVIGAQVGSPKDCPAQIMPRWLAKMVPWLFDNQSKDEAFAWGLRFYEQIARLSGNIPFSVIHDWQANVVGPLAIDLATKRKRDVEAHRKLQTMQQEALAGNKFSADEWRPVLKAAFKDAYAYADAYANADADAYADANANADADAVAHEDAYADDDNYAYAYADAYDDDAYADYAYAYAYANADADAYADANANAYTNADAYTYAYADASAHSYAAADASTYASADAYADYDYSAAYAYADYADAYAHAHAHAI